MYTQTLSQHSSKETMQIDRKMRKYLKKKCANEIIRASAHSSDGKRIEYAHMTRHVSILGKRQAVDYPITRHVLMLKSLQ